MSKRWLYWLVNGIILLGWPWIASAQTVSVSFQQALQLAEQNVMVQQGFRAAQILHNAANASPLMVSNPQVSANLGVRVTPQEEQGPEVQLQITQNLNLQGLGEIRRSSLRAEATLASMQTLIRSLELRERTAIAWVGLWTAQQLFVVAQRNAEIQCSIVPLLERLVALGERTRSDLGAVQSECLHSRLNIEQAEGTLTESRLHLAAEMSLYDGIPEATGTLPEIDRVTAVSLTTATSRLQELPEVRLQQITSQVAMLHAQEETASRGMNLSVGAMLQRDGQGAVSVLATLAVPIPVWDVSLRERAPYQAQAVVAQASVIDQRIRALWALRLAFHEVEHWAGVEQRLREQILPALQTLEAQRRRQVMLRETTMLELLDVQRQVAQANALFVNAQSTKLQAQIRLQLLLLSLGVPTEGAR